MLEKWSIAFADRLIRHSPESKMRAEVLAYALGVYLNLAATVLLALAFGLLTGELAQTLTAMLLFNLTRLFTGGFHFKSLGACALASAALYAAIPWFELAAPTASALTVWALAIFLLLAPASAPETTRLPRRLRPWFKAVAVLLAAANLALSSELFALVLAAQALTLLPVRKGGEDR
ncbi:accessory gene regulator B family protein [Paenibacillus pasadenensis]|uniref:accessory gene regulator B family protein n=1 Tax=Paenibacillus TaxID=44249 RepID=UPI0003FE4303|nr:MULTISPECIES: accessory gene regulator B family protein [Paenibacillus]QGG54628.1 hypothetical protein GE073_02760 [Paenibacillus sp. B01]